MKSTNIDQAGRYLALAIQGLLAAIEERASDRVTARLSSAFGGNSRAALGAVGDGLAKGQKRDPKVIEATTEKLLAHIRKNPGERIEPIGKALGIATKDLTLPVRKLIESKRVKTRGQRRATTYFPR
jgi:hypothetical protein